MRKYLLLTLLSSSPFLSNGQAFKVGVFWPPVWRDTNEDQYRRLSEAYVDVVQNSDGTDLNTPEKNLKMLDLAKKFGMKVCVFDKRIKGSEKDIRDMVETYQAHSATDGYFIQDEPHPGDLVWAARTYRTVASLDKSRVPYVNLFPVFAVKNYETDYVDKWIGMAGPGTVKYLSFDNYPFRYRGQLQTTYFSNLDIIRRTGLKYQIPTSCYLQSFGLVGFHDLPDENRMRFNAYSTLAYGFKNLTWFCYGTPTRQGNQKYMNCVIDSLGTPTALYPSFQRINKEMRFLGRTLKYLDAIEVFHSGDSLWAGTERLPETFPVQPTDLTAPLIFSRMKDRRGKKEWLMVVNRSFKKGGLFGFKKDASVVSFREVSKEDGRARRVDIGQLSFLPGEGRLFEVIRRVTTTK